MNRGIVGRWASVALVVVLGLALAAPAEAGRPYKIGTFKGWDESNYPEAHLPKRVSMKITKRKVKNFKAMPSMFCSGGERGEVYSRQENIDGSPYMPEAQITKKDGKGVFREVMRGDIYITDGPGGEVVDQGTTKAVLKGSVKGKRARGFINYTSTIDSGEVCETGRQKWKAKKV